MGVILFVVLAYLIAGAVFIGVVLGDRRVGKTTARASGGMAPVGNCRDRGNRPLWLRSPMGLGSEYGKAERKPRLLRRLVVRFPMNARVTPLPPCSPVQNLRFSVPTLNAGAP
jgi:hypothetical protein